MAVALDAVVAVDWKTNVNSFQNYFHQHHSQHDHPCAMEEERNLVVAEEVRLATKPSRRMYPYLKLFTVFEITCYKSYLNITITRLKKVRQFYLLSE